MDTRCDKVVICWNFCVKPMSSAVYKNLKKTSERLQSLIGCLLGSRLYQFGDHAVAETNAVN
jgi:hypothetical protein